MCTRNRAASLAATLASLAAQTLDRARYEVIVVDNASTDDTAAVVRRATLPGLRLVAEPRVGLSPARNAGVAAATGSVVAFLDDDAVADEGWLDAVARACLPGVAAVTGRVLPIWEAPRPAWLEDALLPYLSLVDRGRYAAALGPGRWLCGTNMAIRRAALADVGGFPDDLGRTDGTLRSMEEVVVQRWLEARGLATRYDPALVVRHRVPAARMTPAWFERRAFWQGVSSARCERHCAGVLAARPWLCFAGFTAGLAARAWTLAGRGRPRGLARRCEALMRAGYVLGWSGLVA